MSEQSEALKERTMSFSIDVLRLIDRLPHSVAGDVVARQLARSATSVAANYRSVCAARSRPDFVAKLSIVVEEAEECVYWLDLVVRAKLVEDALTLRRESTELRAIFSKSLGTARANRRAAANSTHGWGQQIVKSSH
jgi:four helix bundle protein